MGVPGAFQGRLFAPLENESSRQQGVSNWSLPIWVMASISPTVGQGLGSLDPAVYLHKRVADAMNIQEGDIIEIEFLDPVDRFETPVHIKEHMVADVVVHGALFLGLVQSERIGADGWTMVWRSGQMVESVMQELWAGLKMHVMKGTAVLYFDGASRNNPKGPAGYGYSIVSQQGGDLVRGYGYYKSGSNNEMEYKGLLEGLTWALRLDLQQLTVRGDSDLVINQCNGVYQVRNSTLRGYHQKIKSLLTEAAEQGTHVSLRHIPRNKNVRANDLANLGIDSQTHNTVCHWDNINKLCHREPW